MAKRYEQTKPPRFHVERSAAGERIVVPARRNWFFAAIITPWLLIWTLVALEMVISAPDFAPRGLGLLLLLVPWLLFGPALVWQFAGKDVLRIHGGDLEIGQSLFGWTRWRCYRGSEVGNLAAAPRPPFWEQMNMEIPFLMKPRFGAVKFSYGARTFFAAPGLDEAEGRLIVEWLAQRLPRLDAGG